MMDNKYRIIIMFLFILSTAFVNGQSDKVNYKKEPVWIKMMDDPYANFFETVKAFRQYYKERVLPKEPFEVEGQDSFEKEVGLEEENGKKKSKRELEREQRRANPNDVVYAAEVRAFRSWFYSVQSWVRTDGSIISKQEQQAIIDIQQAELKETEKVNGKK